MAFSLYNTVTMGNKNDFLMSHTAFHTFGMYLHGQSSWHLYVAFQLLQNMASGHIKVKKGLARQSTWPLPVRQLRVCPYVS